MRLVLDTNQFVFSLGAHRKTSCILLLDKLIDLWPGHKITIPELVVEETRRNLSPEAFREFLGLTKDIVLIKTNTIVPFDLRSKYEARGMKPADALIGAFTETVAADVLVSENRHFLARQENLPFEILNAQNCLKIL